jgi:deazaflavin-dependent oxidoreductase (nitroreductase family)
VLVNSGDDSQAFANPRQPKYGEPVARYSAIRGRNLTTYEAAIERFASSRVGAWLFLHVINPIDRRVLPLSRGRLSLAVGAPVGLLQSVGARTGQVRRTPLLYLRDAGGIVVVASNGGSRRHPAWLHNIKANPDIWLLSAEDGWRPYHARIEAGDARAERWARALDLYAGYRRYQQRTPRRQIPVVVLDRTSDEDMHPPAESSSDGSRPGGRHGLRLSGRRSKVLSSVRRPVFGSRPCTEHSDSGRGRRRP